MSDESNDGHEQQDTESAIVPAGAARIVRSLRGGKRAALESLIMGKSISGTARAAGVSRRTLYNWLKKDARFRAAFNQWQDALQQNCRARLLALTEKATDAVGKAMEDGDAKTAMQLLKGLGFLEPVRPPLTNAAEIMEQEELDNKERRIRREIDNLHLDTDKRDAEKFW